MITITVSGHANTGKSTICAAIAIALKEHGFNVEAELLDYQTLDDITHINERLEHVVNKYEDITIIERQTHRKNNERV